MANGIGTPNLLPGTTPVEVLGHEQVGEQKATRRYTMQALANGLSPFILQSAALTVETLAELQAITTYPDYTGAVVYNDPGGDPVNGIYQFLSGSWTRIAPLISTTLSSLTVTTTASFGGAATFGSTVAIADDLTAGTLAVTGAASFTTLSTSGNATFGGTLGVTGAVTLSSTLGVTGNATFSANASITGTLGVTGATTLTTLGTSGLATLNSLSVTTTASFGGAATFGSTVAVTGAATFQAAVILAEGENADQVATGRPYKEAIADGDGVTHGGITYAGEFDHVFSTEGLRTLADQERDLDADARSITTTPLGVRPSKRGRILRLSYFGETFDAEQLYPEHSWADTAMAQGDPWVLAVTGQSQPTAAQVYGLHDEVFHKHHVFSMMNPTSAFDRLSYYSGGALPDYLGDHKGLDLAYPKFVNGTLTDHYLFGELVADAFIHYCRLHGVQPRPVLVWMSAGTDAVLSSIYEPGTNIFDQLMNGAKRVAHVAWKNYGGEAELLGAIGIHGEAGTFAGPDYSYYDAYYSDWIDNVTTGLGDALSEAFPYAPSDPAHWFAVQVSGRGTGGANDEPAGTIQMAELLARYGSGATMCAPSHWIAKGNLFSPLTTDITHWDATAKLMLADVVAYKIFRQRVLGIDDRPFCMDPSSIVRVGAVITARCFGQAGLGPFSKPRLDTDIVAAIANGGVSYTNDSSPPAIASIAFNFKSPVGTLTPWDMVVTLASDPGSPTGELLRVAMDNLTDASGWVRARSTWYVDTGVTTFYGGVLGMTPMRTVRDYMMRQEEAVTT